MCYVSEERFICLVPRVALGVIFTQMLKRMFPK